MGEFRYRFECMVNHRRFSKTYHFYTETPKEIKKKYIEWRMMCEKGSFVNTSYTLEEFSKIWFENYVEPNCAASVQKTYRSNLKNWIVPKLGFYHLTEITPLVLDNFINYLKNSYTKYTCRENKLLTNRTIEKIFENVRTMLTVAYKKGLIATNPCDRVTLQLKRTCDTRTHYWDVEIYKRVIELLEQEKDEEKAFVIEFALKTGLRRSEMFGLTWDDVDFYHKTITINKSRQKVDGKMVILPCKNLSSIRTISISQSIVDKLLAIKNTTHTTFIFENIDYDNVTAWYRKWVRSHNLPYIRFHDLRHTHASLLLCKGIDIKTISERLGHSNISTTMNIYTHVMHELDVKASEAIESI